MALITRVSQLFKADLNAVLDCLEEPEQLLKQAVRDMEDELADSERRIKACAQEQEALQARKQAIRASMDELDEQLDLCFESGKDDLARGIIRRKLEAGRMMKGLDARLEDGARFLETDRKLLDENRKTLEGLRQKADLFVGRPAAGRANHEGLRPLSRELSVSDDEVEVAYLREKSARSAS